MNTISKIKNTVTTIPRLFLAQRPVILLLAVDIPPKDFYILD